MKLKPYLWGIRISTMISFLAWMLVIKQVDPEKTGIIGQVLFFGSTFLFFSSAFILFFNWLRKCAGGGEEKVLMYIGISFRQGVLMSFLAIVLLFLQKNRVLTWWDGALVVAGIFLVELYFLTRK